MTCFNSFEDILLNVNFMQGYKTRDFNAALLACAVQMAKEMLTTLR
jgi:hypothetical protein